MKKWCFIVLLCFYCLAGTHAISCTLPPQEGSAGKGGSHWSIERDGSINLQEFQKEVARAIAERYHATVATTEAVYYPVHAPILFFTFEGDHRRRYGFGWQEGHILHVSVLPENPLHKRFLDLRNAGNELITSLSVKQLIQGESPFVCLYRNDSWQAWYVIFRKEGISFRIVWSIAPWTSVKGAFTESNTFTFHDLDSDGDYEIANRVERCDNCWSERPEIEKYRELYKWNGMGYELLHREMDLPNQKN